MEFNIENGQLYLQNEQERILIATALITGEASVEFQVQKLEKHNNEWRVHWLLPQQATLMQTYMPTQTTNCLAYEMHLTVVGALKGIIQQTYGSKNQQPPYYQIPGFFYGTNNAKNTTGRQPQLAYRGQLQYPHTPLIFTRADRSTHNTVLTVTEKAVLGVRIAERTQGSVKVQTGLGIDTRANDEYDRIALTIGFAHLPMWYRGKLNADSLQIPTNKGDLTLPAMAKLTVTGHLYFAPAANRYAYEQVIEAFYHQIHQPPQPRSNQQEAITLLTEALVNDAYHWQNHYFPSIVTLGEPLTTAGDTAWTGGMQVIYPLAKAMRFYPAAQAVVVDYITELVTDGFNPDSQMFFESKQGKQWHVSGWWSADLPVPDAYSAYVNGQAVAYLVKTIAIMNEVDPTVDTRTWLATAKRVMDHVITQQRADGAFATYYDCEGRALSYESFQGAWFFAASAQLAQLTNEPVYLTACERAVDFYAQFIDQVEVWGMPIDAKNAVDEEGNLAFISGLKTLHELSQHPRYLELLVHCLHYEYSWKFAYNTQFVNEPLQSMQWSSCGGSITSTHNLHIHPMGNLIAEECNYVYEQTKNPYFRQRLQDTLLWGLQSFNSPNYDFGFGKLGWATEQFFHTDAVQDDPTRLEDGGIWPAYLPWGAACILLSLCHDWREILPATSIRSGG